LLEPNRGDIFWVKYRSAGAFKFDLEFIPITIGIEI